MRSKTRSAPYSKRSPAVLLTSSSRIQPSAAQTPSCASKMMPSLLIKIAGAVVDWESEGFMKLVRNVQQSRERRTCHLVTCPNYWLSRNYLSDFPRGFLSEV